MLKGGLRTYDHEADSVIGENQQRQSAFSSFKFAMCIEGASEARCATDAAAIGSQYAADTIEICEQIEGLL